MNGSNSNTSGGSVANVGFWPRGILQRLVSLIQDSATTVKNVLDGNTTKAAVDAVQGSGTDKISDERMAEIARRLIVTVEDNVQSNVVYSPTAPDDKTKLWWQTDPLSNLPIGRLKKWDDEAGEWVNVATPDEPFIPPKKRHGLMASPSGISTQNFSFVDIDTTDYKVTLTPTTFIGGSWAVAPTSFPSTFGFVIINKTNTICSVAFYGIPSGGLTWEIDIEDRQTVS